MAEKDYNLEVGKKIREKRQSMKIGQTELGKRVDTSQSTVSAWEKGQRPITVETVYRVSEALGVPPASLLPDLHDGTPTPSAIADALDRIVAWARGEAKDWRPEPEPTPGDEAARRQNGGRGDREAG